MNTLVTELHSELCLSDNYFDPLFYVVYGRSGQQQVDRKVLVLEKGEVPRKD